LIVPGGAFMTDLELLALIAVGLYLSECILWVRRGHMVFWRPPFGHYRHAQPAVTLGNERAGFVGANPLPPLGQTFVCGPWPMSLSAEAAWSFVSPTLARVGRPPQAPRFVLLDEVREVTQDGTMVLVNGEPFLDAGEHAAAGRYAALLRTVAKLPRQRRDAAIERELRRATDADAVARTVAAFGRRTVFVRLLCQVLFLLLVCVLPLMAWDNRLTAWWPEYLLVLASSLIGVLVFFAATHRRLYPEASGPRWRTFATMLLAPTLAARACDILSRPLLARYHPLAAAAALCDKSTFRQLARSVLLDVRHPAMPVCPDPKREDLERSSRERLARALERLVERQGLNPAELTAPLPPEDSACVSYCPRCDRQYLVAASTCADCGGLALVPFPPSGETPTRPTDTKSEIVTTRSPS
jgi:hypothetical protein